MFNASELTEYVNTVTSQEFVREHIMTGLAEAGIYCPMSNATTRLGLSEFQPDHSVTLHISLTMNREVFLDQLLNHDKPKAALTKPYELSGEDK